MFRLPQREMDLRTGSTTVVLLADKSGSMCSSTFDTMDEVVPHFRGAIPGLRVFVFHADVREVEFRYPSGNIKSAWACDGITDAEWRREARTGRMIRRNTTYLGAALEAVAGLKPCKTIVFCDGGAADKSRALRAADNITGEIDCYFFPSKMAGYDDVGFMEKLARRGRGRLVRFDGRADMGDELRRSLPVPQPHNPHHGAPSHMRRPIPGGRVDVRAAPDQAHVIYEDIHLFRQRRIHTHHLPDQQIEHGEAESVSVDMAATQVNVQHAEQPILGRHESSHGWFTTFIDRLVNARPAAVQDRGQLQALPQRASASALPAPEARPMPVSTVPQIVHQPAAQFDAPRERASWAKAILGD